ncbi:MAG TPA: hypothetical protein PK771_13205, partial [Spirochaetota bacterium]|nr:hypothetical protein [Spirochaetota bacterium]
MGQTIVRSKDLDFSVTTNKKILNILSIRLEYKEKICYNCIQYLYCLESCMSEKNPIGDKGDGTFFKV